MVKRLLVFLFVSSSIVYCNSTLSGATGGAKSDSNSPSAEFATKRPPYSHIFVIMLENVGYENVIGSANAPYINTKLLLQATLYTNSFGISHPSLPNYLAMFAGSTLWVTNDHCLSGSP